MTQFFLHLYLFYCYFYLVVSDSITPYEPSITYLDGTNQWEKCNPYIGRTLTGKSGILISHSGYGTSPYKGSKNCILMIAAPLGYQVRLRILDFNIPGVSGVCEQEALHILNVSLLLVFTFRNSYFSMKIL